MTYQATLHQIAPHLNPAGVEAHMRCEYGTLGHLPHGRFVAEAKLASACEMEQPGYLKMVADSFGLSRDFETWEARR